MIRITDIRQELSESFDEVRLRLEAKYHTEFSLFRPARQSLDARKKQDIHYVLTVEAECKDESRLLKEKRIARAEPYRYHLPTVTCRPAHPPVVVGAGPAGLFAALTLAEAGLCPVLIERGKPVDVRALDVERFWQTGELDPDSNVQFGEGGAGTFSDGKLTTGTKDERQRKVLEELVSAGAPEDIRYKAKPHIGTDRLPEAVRGIRKKILSLGGNVRFMTCLTGILQEEGRVTGVRVACEGREETLPTENVILAIGHSARDTFALLRDMGIKMEQKTFSVGVRVEHRQADIDRAQYGETTVPEPADYKLSYHTAEGRGVYTFCMCPGGFVVPAASEPGRLVTNGMSAYARDGENANSALLVNVTPGDFGSDDVLAGAELQRRLEEAAFRAAGDYRAPVQLLGDFLRGTESAAFGRVTPTYARGTVFCGMEKIFPSYIIDAMKEAIPAMGKKLSGFDAPDAVMTAPETRSSSPVRIQRDARGESVTLKGLYPCGEGAGYAGGIMSAAVDGIRTAERMIAKEG